MSRCPPVIVLSDHDHPDIVSASPAAIEYLGAGVFLPDRDPPWGPLGWR
jgi:hypothetical protein